jgi:putative transposase
MAAQPRSRRRFCWAHFRHSVVGPLLAAPPEPGGLRGALEDLAQKEWKHPITGERYKIGFSTLERWYYEAKRAGDDPVSALLPKIREDSGTQRVLSQEAKKALLAQYRTHKSWSYQLHFDNLKARIEEDSRLGPLPSYWTILRFMKNHGLVKQRRRRRRDTEAARRAEARLEEREVRGFEMENVNALWHYDFHAGSLKVLTPAGTWETPKILAILDDCSRLVCHAQWYLEETAEVLVHGLCQAYQKRGLPRSDMSDNGSAMKAAEVVQGLERLGIIHYPTLEHSPYQNGKQEVSTASKFGWIP